MENLERKECESFQAWKIRCCLAKKRNETDMDWVEIRDMLGLTITPDQLRKVSVGYLEYDNLIHSDDSVATKILSISDLHIPYQLPFENLTEYRGVDVLQINGDVIDCQAISKYTRQYRIPVMEEIITGRQYLIDLFNYIKPKKVVCNIGNHDSRFATYLAKNLDSDILELMPDTSLELIFDYGFRHFDKRSGAKIWYEPLKNVFEDIEIKFVDDWKSKIGKTWFVHPTAYKSGFLATAEKAKCYLQDTDKEGFDCVVLAHTHNVADGKQGYIRLLEQGAFAKTEEMNYMGGKLTRPQKQGFAVICQDANGNLIDSKTRVIKLN